MYCKRCNGDLNTYIDDSGFDCLEPCPDCIAEVYADGIKFAWKLAEKDIEDLPEALSKSGLIHQS